LTVLHSLFSGLDRQSEITELLEELYYDCLERAPRDPHWSRGSREARTPARTLK